MRIFSKIFSLFYKRKIQEDEIITQILFWRRRRKVTEQDWKNISDQMFFKPTFPVCQQVGRQTYCSSSTFIASSNTVIGSFCSIGSNVFIGHGAHPLHFVSTSPFLYLDIFGYKKKETRSHNEYWAHKVTPVYIGNDVWIGHNVFIKNGVHVGDGAVIGAGSVVTKDVAPYAIVVGNPAKVLRYRFDAQTIERLLHVKWWNQPDEIIQSLPYDDVEQTLNILENLLSSKHL